MTEQQQTRRCQRLIAGILGYAVREALEAGDAARAKRKRQKAREWLAHGLAARAYCAILDIDHSAFVLALERQYAAGGDATGLIQGFTRRQQELAAAT